VNQIEFEEADHLASGRFTGLSAGVMKMRRKLSPLTHNRYVLIFISDRSDRALLPD